MDELKITGTVKQLLEEQSGEGRNGPWRKREFILQTEGNYPKDVCIVQWGDAIDSAPVREGERITAHIDIQSREFKGRWYTDVKAWRVEQAGPGASEGAPDFSGEPFPEPAGDDFDDDLPF